MIPRCTSGGSGTQVLGCSCGLWFRAQADFPSLRGGSLGLLVSELLPPGAPPGASLGGPVWPLGGERLAHWLRGHFLGGDSPGPRLPPPAVPCPRRGKCRGFSACGAAAGLELERLDGHLSGGSWMSCCWPFLIQSRPLTRQASRVTLAWFPGWSTASRTGSGRAAPSYPGWRLRGRLRGREEGRQARA